MNKHIAILALLSVSSGYAEHTGRVDKVLSSIPGGYVLVTPEDYNVYQLEKEIEKEKNEDKQAELEEALKTQQERNASWTPKRKTVAGLGIGAVAFVCWVLAKKK